MRVLVFSGYFLPHKGGVENYVYEVYRRLSGIEATIVTVNTEGAPTKERLDGLDIIRLSGWNIIGKSFPIPKPSAQTFRLLRELRNQTFDVVNTHTRFFLTSLIGVLLAKIKHLPVLHTEHGSDHIRHASRVVEWVGLLYDYTLGKIIFRLANKTIGVSRASADFARRMGARNTGDFVFNGVDTELFHRRNTALKQKLGIPPSHLVVTCAGRLMKAKGPDLLIRSFKKLDRADTQLLMIGDGPMMSELRRLSGDDRRIHLLGGQAHQHIPEFLSITDIFVLPTTTHPEGLPTVVLEAGACLCAVIATDRGGTREVIHDGETGLLLTYPTDEALTAAIDQLLSNPGLREKLAQSLYLFVQKSFRWDDLADTYKKVLDATIRQQIPAN